MYNVLPSGNQCILALTWGPSTMCDQVHFHNNLPFLCHLRYLYSLRHLFDIAHSHTEAMLKYDEVDINTKLISLK